MMKRILISWMCFFCCVSTLRAELQSVENKRLRDSVFQVYQTMPLDSTRPIFLRRMFQRYIGQEWSTEFLDSALAVSMQNGWQKMELNTRFDFLRHFQYVGKREEYAQSFAQLKQAAYRYGSYELYFRGWEVYLRSRVTKGDTEYVMLEARKMRDEAIRLKHKRGIFLSYMALANAQTAARLYEEAIATYKKAMELPGVNTSGKMNMHETLSAIYLNRREYEKSLEELEAQRVILQRLIENSPNGLFNYGPRMLANRLKRCKVYSRLEDAKELKKGLEEAGKYYSDDCYFSSYITYHSLWGEYYSLTHQWEKCFAAYDDALSRCNGAQVIYENSILEYKAAAVIKSGNYKYGAELYREVALESDSINKDILRLHEEALQANYRIKKALFDKEQNEIKFRQVLVGSAFFLLMTIVLAVVRLYQIRYSLKKSEEEIRRAYGTVEAANKMKEVFLRNIIKEIRMPLNTVVRLSGLLCKRNDLTAEQLQTYSTKIKNAAEKLMVLIVNVLDLSRLESGMMKFDVQECDAVQLCKEARQETEMYDDNQRLLTFETQLSALPIVTDYNRFMKLLLSVLSFPKDDKGTSLVSYSLEHEGNEVLITVRNSPLLKLDTDEQMCQIQHDINSLFLQHFGGTYRLSEADEESIIIITYPLKKRKD